MSERPEGHSPLGASGAYQWMACPASVPLSAGCVDEESEFAVEGTAAHAVADVCLVSNTDAWEQMDSVAGPAVYGVDIDPEMVDAVQVYLDRIRLEYPDRNQGNSWVERSFYCPQFHELFYGTADFVYWDQLNRELHVWDYKHGAGVVVDVEHNVQTMYYGCGALEDLGLWAEVDHVILHIAQPRGFHHDGEIREWTISTEDLRDWLHEDLIPAMDVAQGASIEQTKSGTHCRFCTVRSYACPQIMSDMKELEEIMARLNKEGGAGKLKGSEVGHFMDLFQVAKIVNKAAEKTAYARAMNGKNTPGYKLVKARANRTWKLPKKTARLAKEKFGSERFVPRKLRSPNQMEELQGGKKFAARHGYKPDVGYTLVPNSDGRAAVTRKGAKDQFSPVKKKGKK